MEVKKYFSFIKFSHTLFALPFALIGYFLAVKFSAYSFTWTTFALVLLCMVFGRSAAMGFNRYADRKIDAANERTAKIREIPAGKISARSALIFVIVNCSLFVLCTYFINDICFYLSPVALLIILGYSYTKRFTALCHFILGLGLSLAPIGAYLAVVGSFAWLPLYYSFAVLFWVTGFDIIYSLQDFKFDKAQHLKSMPVFFGKKGALRFSRVLHALSAFFIIIAGIHAEFGIIYWIGAIIFCSMLVYQHRIISANDLSRVNFAFFTTNGFASTVFAVFVIAEILL